MADTAEKIQNMNIQDFDGSDFDPFSPHNKMESVPNGGQSETMDLLGQLNDQGHMNGTDKHVSFDRDAGIGLPDPTYISQSQGQTDDMQRHMSEGEILGYQNEYGEMSSHQGEYHADSDEEDQNNLVNFEGTDLDRVAAAQQGQGYSNSGEYSSPERDIDQNDYDQYVENDYVEENDVNVHAEIEYDDEACDGGYENDAIDPENWQPEMDPERLRRSLSPERSVSPAVRHNDSNIESELMSEGSRPQAIGGISEASTIPISPDNTESADLVSQSSQMFSETESLYSECEGTPRRRRRIPKPKKTLELPPWDDNVVIPPLPRMKPTLIGKQADLPPLSPPPRLQRPRTAPARHSAKDASSDSGVEEEKSSLRKMSAEMKKKYGTDSKNERYKPGGGNIQIYNKKLDTKYVAPRTDTTKPKSALMSPRISPSKEKPSTPKPPTPNTKAVQSKIGSLNNVKHTPGGGNIKVLNAKVDFSTVSSKVGSKDKIHHQPKGGDKKIESQKLIWQTESKVGSLKNASHSPGGGNVKECIVEIHRSMDYDEESMTMTGYTTPNKTQNRKADSASHRRTKSISLTNGGNGKEDTVLALDRVVEPVNYSFIPCRILEPVPEIEYHTVSDAAITDSDPVLGIEYQSVSDAARTDSDPIPEIGYQSVSDLARTNSDPVLEIGYQSVSDLARTNSDPVLEIGYQSVSDAARTDSNPVQTNLRQIEFNGNELIEYKMNQEQIDEVIEDELNDTRMGLDHACLNDDALIEVELNDTNLEENQVHLGFCDVVEDKSNKINRAELINFHDILMKDKEVVMDAEKELNDHSVNVKTHCNETYDLDWKKGPPLPPKLHANIGEHENLDENDICVAGKINVTNDKINEVISVKTNTNVNYQPSLTNKAESDDDNDTRDDQDNGYKWQEVNDKSTLDEPLELLFNDSQIYHDIPLNEVGIDHSECTSSIETDDVNETAKKSEYTGIVERKSGLVSKIKAMFHTKPRHTKQKPVANCRLSYSDNSSNDSDLVFNYHLNEKEIKHSSTEEENEIGIMSDDSAHTGQRYEADRHVVLGNAKKEKRKQIIYKRQKESNFTKVNDKSLCKQTDSKSDTNAIVTESLQLETPSNLLDSEYPVKHWFDFPEESHYHEIPCNLSVTYNLSDEQKTHSERFQWVSVIPVDNSDVLSSNMPTNELTAVYDHPKPCIKYTKINSTFSEGITNDGYVYDEVASDESSVADDSDSDKEFEWSLDDVHNYTSIAELKVNAAPKIHKGIQTTVFRYKMDQRHTSPLKEIRQEQIDILQQSFPNVKERADLTDNNSSLGRSCSLKVAPEHDKFEYAVVMKKSHSRSLENVQMSKQKGRARDEVCASQRSVLSQKDQVSVRDVEKNSVHLVQQKPPDCVKPSALDNLNNFNRNDIKTESEGNKHCAQFTNKCGTKTGGPEGRHYTGSVNVEKENIAVCTKDNRNTAEELIPDPKKELAADMVVKQRLSWSAHSRVGSLDNYSHSPGGGNVKILDQKVEVKAQSKIGSTANMKHKPGGGDKKIETQKLEFKDSARSKVGSMDKVKHKPGGGDIKVFNEKTKWETTSRVKSLENATHSPGGGNVKIVDEKPVWTVSSKVESLVNADHVPGGGKVKIVDEKPVWTAGSKVESLINADHIPGGGNVKILDEKVDFTGTAKSRVGSMDKVKHQPGGGDKRIETQKLTFKETAKARTDTGGVTGEKRKSHDNSRSASVTSSQDGSVQD